MAIWREKKCIDKRIQYTEEKGRTMELWKVSLEMYERIIKALYMKYGEKQD